jgi:hypothetical protein
MQLLKRIVQTNTYNHGDCKERRKKERMENKENGLILSNERGST